MPDGTARRHTGHGPGRLLVAVYAVFAVSTGTRAAFQLGTKAAEAPVPYALSATAAAVYLVAALALARQRVGLATTALLVELGGVLVVGTVSLLRPQDFPDATVWSSYGRGYGWLPLVLPVLGLLWLARSTRRP